MTARSAAVYMANALRELDRTSLPRLPPAPGCDGEAEYLRQVDLWKTWINWERSDPLEDKATDPATYKARVLFAYKQALMALRFWPEMWYEAAEWCFQNDQEAEGNNILTQGIEANPESLLLAFKRADRVEITSVNEDGEDAPRKRGDAVREPYNHLLDALYALTKKIKERGDEELARGREVLAQQAAMEDHPMNDDDDDDDDQPNGDGALQERAKEREAQREVQLAALKAAGDAQVEEMKKLITTAWIGLMRAMRRVQGKGKPNDPTTVGGSRQVFADCRKRGFLTSEIYVAAALIEHYAYKEPAGTKIFERGVKLFPEDEHLVLEYLKHLIAINDITSKSLHATQPSTR
ncbi:MAG: hypothetical protein INR71_02140 [Terriglobus roseus]|nr:hypothetical protein [Terriglobus roseus]